MNKPPSKRRKATISASTDSEPPASSTENSSNQEDPASATITVTAVEVRELTEEEQSDKPDGMATLTANARGERIGRLYSDSLEETVKNLLQLLGKLNP